jgi:3-hydroxyisobutyrate dehydrogenase
MKVGFIGLGHVGAKLAGSLLRNDFDLTVRDIDQAVVDDLVTRGASTVESGKVLAEKCDVIITCLPSPKISARVMEEDEGVIAGLSEGKVWMEMSSSDADEVKRLGQLVQAKGAEALDSPVSGGCHRAATGNIAILVGGNRSAFDRVMPLLKIVGRQILHTGPLGTASIMKVATNYLAGVQLISTGEAFMVAKQAGVDLSVAYEAIRISSGNSFVHETEGQVILNGSYNINFTLDHEVKDLTLFDDLGKKYEIPLELSPLCVAIMKDGLKRYGPRAWSSMVVKRLEDDCAVDLRAPGFPEFLVDSEPEAMGVEVVVRELSTPD